MIVACISANNRYASISAVKNTLTFRGVARIRVRIFFSRYDANVVARPITE